MNIYAAEFDFEPTLPFSIQPYLLKKTDNARHTYHWHSCYEFTYIRSGEAFYYVGEKSYSVKSGDFILFNPVEYHGWELLSDTMEVMVMLFPAALLQEEMAVKHLQYLKAFFEQGGYYQNYINGDDVNAKELREIFSSADQEFRERIPGYEIMIHADVQKLLTVLTRYYVKTEVSLHDFNIRAAAAKQLEPAILYIYYNYAEDITLKQMAELCCISPNYFSAYFKRICGSSFIQYLNEIRVQQARKQLLMTEKDILTISLDCGFTNLSNFYRIYQKYTGRTPGGERNIEKKRKLTI